MFRGFSSYSAAHHRPRPHRLMVGLSLLGILALGTLIFPTPSLAQDSATPEAGGATPPVVAVSADGRVTIEPDTATATIGVDVQRPTLAEAQSESTTQMTAIIDAITGFGVAEEDIQTSNFNVSVVQNYDQQGNPTEILGYRVSNQVNVKVREIDRLGELLDTAVSAGANTIWGVWFYLDDPSEAASQARAQAVDNARAKAEELADAAGMSLGRVVSISEGYSPPPMPLPFEGRAAGDMAQGAGASVPIQIGTTEVMVSVQMVFELV